LKWKRIKKAQPRRKFLWGGLGVLSTLSVLKFIIPKKKPVAIACTTTPTTAKMLTEDGKLVEVDISKIKKTGVKVSDKDVISWVKNNQRFNIIQWKKIQEEIF
jgi:hypothetical protein